ncbi:MAG: cobalt-precorrin-5B (C(1))-methyltransferase [Desulfobulbaceae bacterium]|nr:cobalt-precorrin-5B (C(1))-methyltransferase [Desulfobulbaceae bacterium]
MAKNNTKKLRSGYSTGACSAAVAKAATLHLLGSNKGVQEVTIPFPDHSRHSFTIKTSLLDGGIAKATTIKDAGDDPDVTNGATIGAIVRFSTEPRDEKVTILGGPGVGKVTKPGLPISIGQPAINPVPRSMIKAAVEEGMQEQDAGQKNLEVTIFIENGEELAKKTLNKRLGILGGLSVLGTTGIVRPVSAKAWTATIDSSMKVAVAVGLDEIILSTGRTSEAAVAAKLELPEESLVMMGDYLEYALKAAAKHGFRKIHLAGMWAKIVKAALEIPQTHVRNGALEISNCVKLLRDLGLDNNLATELEQANTAREIYLRLKENGSYNLIRAVCARARDYAQKCSGLAVDVYLVTSEEGVVEYVDN